MFKKFTKTVAILSTIMIKLGVTTPAQAASCETGRTTATVNVRTGASTKYRKIGKLYKGKKVNLYKSTKGWYKIKYNGRYGWVSKKYITKSSYSSGEESSNSIKGYKVKKSLRVRAVAYSSGSCTALGTKLRYGVIAVDPRVIPYRTKVYIKELDRVFVAEDCGGGIKGNIIDIYMPSESQCNRWGSRNITIQILK